MVTRLTKQNFREAISQGLIIVDFWAEWCGPCQMLAPIFEELSREYQAKLKFAKVNTDDYPEVATENRITGIPCLIVFKEGKEIDRIIGMTSKEVLKEKIEGMLGKV